MQCSKYNPERREPGGCRPGEEGRLHTGFGGGVGYLPQAMNICTTHSINTRAQLNFPSVLEGLCSRSAPNLHPTSCH